jgi:thioester reductase-like protein
MDSARFEWPMTWTNSTRAAFHDQPPRSLLERSQWRLLARQVEAVADVAAVVGHPESILRVGRALSSQRIFGSAQPRSARKFRLLSSPGLPLRLSRVGERCMSSMS